MDVNCLFQTVLNKTINIELKLKISNCADKFFNWAHNLQTFVYIILLWPRRLYLHNEFNPYHIHKIQILNVNYSSTLEDLRTIHSSHTSHTTYHLFLLQVNTKYLFQLRFGLRFLNQTNTISLFCPERLQLSCNGILFKIIICVK